MFERWSQADAVRTMFLLFFLQFSVGGFFRVAVFFFVQTSIFLDLQLFATISYGFFRDADSEVSFQKQIGEFSRKITPKK